MTIPKPKEYLGDAVYAEINAYGALILWTDDGLGRLDEIVLEPEVLAKLFEFLGIDVASLQINMRDDGP